MYSNNGLVKAFTAGAACRARRLAVFGAADNTVIEATGPAQPVIGVFDQVDAASADRVDVIMEGIAEVLLGGTVTRGAFLTSDAAGAAVAAAPAAGINNVVFGRALVSGVAGDIIPVHLIHASLQG